MAGVDVRANGVLAAPRGRAGTGRACRVGPAATGEHRLRPGSCVSAASSATPETRAQGPRRAGAAFGSAPAVGSADHVDFGSGAAAGAIGGGELDVGRGLWESAEI